MKSTPSLQVAVDVGSRSHCVIIGLSDGSILDEFTIAHSPSGFDEFFQRIEHQERLYALPVAVAMEGYNGWARPLDNEVLRRGWRLLSRRRRQLVNEKVIVENRLQSDLQAVCPSLFEITGSVDNQWFLRFLTCRESLPKLLHLHRKSLFGIRGVGRIYAELIRNWQRRARFSDEVDYVGPMILQDAHRLLALLEAIKTLENELDRVIGESVYARHIDTIPGFGLICSAELAGEIGTLQRFRTSDSFAFYLGMAPLDNQSGAYRGSKAPRHVNTRVRKARQ